MVMLLVFALLGLRAAEMTSLPSSIVQEAKAIASKVSQQLLVWFIIYQILSLPFMYSPYLPVRQLHAQILCNIKTKFHINEISISPSGTVRCHDIQCNRSSG